MQRSYVLRAIVGCLLAGTTLWGARNTQWFKLFHAGVKVAEEAGEDAFPDAVRDRALEMSISRWNQDVVDCTVDMTQQKVKLERRQEEIASLKKEINDIETLLSEASETLAKADGSNSVTFAQTNYSMDEFQAEIDKLCLVHESKKRKLKNREADLEVLQPSVLNLKERIGLAKETVREFSDELAMLKDRRSAAVNNGRLLGVMQGADAKFTESRAEIEKGLDRIRDEVARIEAKNEAVGNSGELVVPDAFTSKLAKNAERVKKLKEIQDRVAKSKGQLANKG